MIEALPIRRSVEAAVEFPHVQVMGFDLVPNKLMYVRPALDCSDHGHLSRFQKSAIQLQVGKVHFLS
jgi:hypothetical protein